MDNQRDKRVIGRQGEDVAADFLIKQGFSIIDRNYRQKWGEIDIIASKNKNLHFVEVKTVSRDRRPAGVPDDYEPEDNLHLWKRQRLARAIQTYLLAKRIDDDIEWQTDIISVYFDQTGGLLKIDYLPDVIL